ncbi:hypothetical protein AB0O07_01150 [Streptomyces sp. NPDC093085]|uniref:hypothetical protein n=1 Tax=Streptomyces sp. NPDC093085 TaxID=3155068 RepID=UPI003424573A
MSDDETPDAPEAPDAVGGGPGEEKPGEGKPGDQKADRPDKDEARQKADEDQETRESNPFDQAGRNPLSTSGGTGGSATAHTALRNFAADIARRAIGFAGDGQYYEGNTFISQFGVGSTGPSMVQGPVPAEELHRLAEVYCEADDYPEMTERLRAQRLLVLCGERGSGRTATALSLLMSVAGDQVTRLDPGVRVHEIEEIRTGHGHLLAIEPEDTPGRETEQVNGRILTRVRRSGPTELHLDGLRSRLVAAEAFGVLLVENGELADRLLRGRYGVRCPSPPAERVLHRHLRVLLADEPDGTFQEALELAARPEVREAPGLDELRPGEAAGLAGHLARCLRNELTDRELLAACGEFVGAQAREWFAGADRPGTLPEALPGLTAAAFRIAVAVFNGSPYSLTAEAAEQLAWEMAVTLDPETPMGRRLFAPHAAARPAVARALVESGELDLVDDVPVPVQVIRFQGKALATAVLREVWHGHHNVRGPLVRWLRTLCDDSRPVVWVRASIAAGVLCAWDLPYGSAELIAPMSASESPVQQMSAATALAEAAREPSVRPAVAALLKAWAKSDHDELVTTTLLAHGYGMAAGSVGASLDALVKAVVRTDTTDPDRHADALTNASFSTARLLAGPEPETVVRRLETWLRDPRRGPADLALLTVIRALRTKATFLWGLQDTPELEPYGKRMLVSALLESDPELAGRLAALVREALAAPRSGAPALDALALLLRQAVKDPAPLRTACRLLVLLAEGRRDRDRLRHLLTRLVKDPDEPLDKSAARTLWDAVGERTEDMTRQRNRVRSAGLPAGEVRR